jgi:ABC-type polysaccharide/polyol phosphate transport system ATPase subunit
VIVVGEIAVKVENIGMEYNLNKEKVDNIKEWVIKFLKRQLKYTKFWAVRNISFEVEKGTKFGIVGLNGAGKSTLLKIISGVIKPTEGSIEITGKIVPLLELGSGFDPEYTGRENIYLKGALLGYPKEYLEAKFDEIVEFSELGDFIDVPLKNYSTGMSARLAFSLATMVKAQIMILDEVLSVGDAKFKEKSQERMKSLLNEEVTVLFVSHSIGQVRSLCDNAIWIEKGKMIMQGPVDEVCDKYEEYTMSNEKVIILRSEPMSTEVKVPLDKKIKLIFNVNIKTGTGWIDLINNSEEVIPTTKTIEGKTLTITPEELLTKETVYHLHVHTGSVTDMEGNPVSVYTTSFTTIIDG